MKNKMKRILALIVCISFILTFLPINSVSFAKPRYDVWKDKIKVYDVDKKFKRAEAEYEGYKYIATFDEDTNEIKLKVKPIATKKFDKSLDSSSLNEERNFSVKVEYFDGENLKAKLIDEKTKEEYNIGDSDTVSAQYVIALPTVLGLLEELLYILLGAAGIVFVGGATYYLAEKLVDKIRNSSYDYFLAYISDDKKLYVGPAVDFGTAKAVVLDGGDIFAKSRNFAELLVREVVFFASIRGFPQAYYYEHKTPHKDDPNYFPHFHVFFNEIRKRPHIFYPY